MVSRYFVRRKNLADLEVYWTQDVRNAPICIKITVESNNDVSVSYSMAAQTIIPGVGLYADTECMQAMRISQNLQTRIWSSEYV